MRSPIPTGRRYWRWAASLAFIFGVWYLYWRATATLNREDPVALGISVTLYLAEVYGFLAFVLFFIQTRKGVRKRPPPSPREWPTVDVFVTIYDESLQVLHRTLVCCQAMEYSEGRKTIYVLDDGHRDEVRALAERMGCEYLARPGRDFAKAGNLNYGMAHSRGDIIAVFDCDHIPVRSFLTETVGYFEDPKVAIVQTPHFFYNPDSFQRNLRLEQELANEQDLFFRIIEPGRDHYNAAFFAGSSGLFRRSALNEIGGIQTLTLTEDLHTSMILHARGYRSVYVRKILAAGLSPESFEGYLKQRKRWTRGGLQVFILDNPLWKGGLSLAQRLQYFAALFYFFHGLPRMIYLTAPLAYLLFGYPPIVTGIGTLLLHYVPYYAASLFAFHQVSRGNRNPFWSDVYETGICFSITVTALLTVLNPWRSRFHVTPKGLLKENSLFHPRLVLPHLTVIGLILIGGAMGIYHYVHPTGGGGSGTALGISLFWGGYNLMLLLAAVAVARERRQTRLSPRLRRMIFGEIHYTFKGQLQPVEKLRFVCRDISETGISFTVREPQVLPLLVQVLLLGDQGDNISLRGMVMRNDVTASGEGSIGVHFMKLTERDREAILRMMFSHPRTWEQPAPATADFRQSLFFLLLASLRAFFKERILKRLSPRSGARIPCQLLVEERLYPGTIEDISGNGARVALSPKFLSRVAGFAATRMIRLRIQSGSGEALEIPVQMVWRQAREGQALMGLQFMEDHPGIRSQLIFPRSPGKRETPEDQTVHPV